MNITITEVLERLAALGSERVRAQNRKHGAQDNQFGVRLGDIRNVSKELRREIKDGSKLASELWETGNLDARLLAILLIDSKSLPSDRLERMVRSVSCAQEADWLNAYVIKNHPDRETLRGRWMAGKDRWEARAGWNLTSERITKDPEGLDIPTLLTRIDSEMATAAAEVQWTMNFCLAGIGINMPEHRQRALEIGERLGIYRDYPVSKGCTSPFAPIWIAEMVRRQGDVEPS